MLPKTIIVLATAFLSGLAMADGLCRMGGGELQPADQKVETDERYCKPQGKGSYTFAMKVGMIDVPSPPTDAGAHDIPPVWYLYDESCKLLSSYDKPNDCGVPYTIQENYLPYTLTLKEIFTSVASPDFQFAYANGLYSINNDGCGCQDDNDDLKAGAICKCGFPVNGEPQKRAVSFDA